MPIDQKKMGELKKQYGDKEGERVYYALEEKEKNKKEIENKISDVEKMEGSEKIKESTDAIKEKAKNEEDPKKLKKINDELE